METPRSKIAWAAGGFVVGMLLLLFGGSFVQYHLGMWGLVITEIGILAFALLSALASRLDLRKVFRIRRGAAWEWRGCLYIYLGTFFLTYVCVLLLAALFPQMTEVSQDLSSFVTSAPYLFALIAVSILPGICEEAWHRGTLLASLGSIRSVAVRVLIMGIIFGVFHLDLFRFLPTMLLGMGLSYMRIKTDNMLMNMTFHALNNLFSLSVTFLLAPLVENMGAMGATESVTDPAANGIVLSAMVIFALAAGSLFIYLGRTRLNTPPSRLAPPSGSPLVLLPGASPLQLPSAAVRSASETARRRRTIIVLIVCCSVALIACVGCFLGGLLVTLGSGVGA
ncbi:MAG: CPBP family intramembrane metalloprotease [Coriobacteriales bacterium]|jgi:membrane protease YdiL (CAAX protease family)|nr:CPBP family intramembrane metalloprotease [Coriobacteriales bacterium]